MKIEMMQGIVRAAVHPQSYRIMRGGQRGLYARPCRTPSVHGLPAWQKRRRSGTVPSAGACTLKMLRDCCKFTAVAFRAPRSLPCPAAVSARRVGHDQTGSEPKIHGQTAPAKTFSGI